MILQTREMPNAWAYLSPDPYKQRGVGIKLLKSMQFCFYENAVPWQYACLSNTSIHCSTLKQRTRQLLLCPSSSESSSGRIQVPYPLEYTCNKKSYKYIESQITEKVTSQESATISDASMLLKDIQVDCFELTHLHDHIGLVEMRCMQTTCH